MKPAEYKAQFIQLRAQGNSYAAIQKELGIAKETCSKWEKELNAQIAELKAEQLNELYDSYHMTKEARIKKLGDTLANIDDALEGADLSGLSLEKLLDYKLKYTEALKAEYIPTGKGQQLPKDFKASDILAAVGDLLNRVRSGEVTTEQASRESAVLGNLLKAYDAVELKAKLDALEATIRCRG